MGISTVKVSNNVLNDYFPAAVEIYPSLLLDSCCVFDFSVSLVTNKRVHKSDSHPVKK